MKKIQLKCHTAGHNYGDVVAVGGKKGLDEKMAEGLVDDGFAVEVIDHEVKKVKSVKKPEDDKSKDEDSKDEKSKDKSILDKVMGK